MRALMSPNTTSLAWPSEVDICMKAMREPDRRSKNPCGSLRHSTQWDSHGSTIDATVVLPMPMPPVIIASGYFVRWYPSMSSPMISTRHSRMLERTRLSMFR